MNNAIERLLGLRVKDVMSKSVLTVDQSESMQSAAEKLFDAEVTGVPVVDSQGKCVGVLSASDFVGRDAGRHDVLVLTRTNPDEPYVPEYLGDDLVESHMSPLVQTVNAAESIVGAGRLMCLEGIHRLIVVDDQQRPIGIISTLDVTAVVVNSIDE